MSVLMMLRAKGDPAKLEKLAANDPGRIGAISKDAKNYGLIGHRFYGSDDGQILVLDEWPDADSFQRFFAAHQDDIGPMMAEVGSTAPPEITFYRILDTHDEVGWGA
jgi:hypothetical protein